LREGLDEDVAAEKKEAAPAPQSATKLS